ncbi:MAG: hypothetical protein SO251_09615 [Candidatus Fimisoma sp.]|nr:hypothetical protein [Candidatus Fimisoma sp.]
MKLFRKLLTIEQFRNSEMAEMYSRQYFNDPLSYQSALFRIFIGKGKFKKADAEILSLQFYAPIYTLLIVCDRQPEREQEALKMIEGHLQQFSAGCSEDMK